MNDRPLKEWTERIMYHFTTADGVTVSSKGWDAGYRVREGSGVPVFYDPGGRIVEFSLRLNF